MKEGTEAEIVRSMLLLAELAHGEYRFSLAQIEISTNFNRILM